MPSHRRKWTFSDLTPENVRNWQKIRWPFGIKKDLAMLSQDLKAPEGETILYRNLCGYFSYWIITVALTTSRERRDATVRVHKWYFPHPRRVWPEFPKYKRGPGFTIQGELIHNWRTGIERLLRTPQSIPSTSNGVCVYSFDYGTIGRGTTLRKHSIRFYPEIRPAGFHSLQIRDFYLSRGRHVPSNRSVYCYTNNTDLLTEIDRALQVAEMSNNSEPIPQEMMEYKYGFTKKDFEQDTTGRPKR